MVSFAEMGKGPNEFCGILLKGEQSEQKGALEASLRIGWRERRKCHEELHKRLGDAYRRSKGVSHAGTFITNCPRIAKALKMIGYDSLGRATVRGIELFMCGPSTM